MAEGKRPVTDGASALEVLRVLHAAEQSLKASGAPVNAVPVVPKYYAHPSAVIDEPCEIGAGTKIWHFSHIMAKSTIGERCNLGQNVLVSNGVRIGNNVKIQNNVSLYTGVELEDDVFCGPSMVFTNVINPRSHIVRKNEYQRTLVKRGASMGANCTIVCGTTIGESLAWPSSGGSRAGSRCRNGDVRGTPVARLAECWPLPGHGGAGPSGWLDVLLRSPPARKQPPMLLCLRSQVRHREWRVQAVQPRDSYETGSCPRGCGCTRRLARSTSGPNHQLLLHPHLA